IAAELRPQRTGIRAHRTHGRLHAVPPEAGRPGTPLPRRHPYLQLGPEIRRIGTASNGRKAHTPALHDSCRTVPAPARTAPRPAATHAPGIPGLLAGNHAREPKPHPGEAEMRHGLPQTADRPAAS